MFELWALSFETASENVTPSGIGCTYLYKCASYTHVYASTFLQITYTSVDSVGSEFILFKSLDQTSQLCHVFCFINKHIIIQRIVQSVSPSLAVSFIVKCHRDWPPDPISDVCSLTGKYISRKHFTYRPVQIFKIIFRRFLFSRIWSSAQDHALLVLLLNLVGFFISTRPRWSGGNDLYHSCTNFERTSRGCQPLNISTWFIGAGGTREADNQKLTDTSIEEGGHAAHGSWRMQHTVAVPLPVAHQFSPVQARSSCHVLHPQHKVYGNLEGALSPNMLRCWSPFLDTPKRSSIFSSGCEVAQVDSVRTSGRGSIAWNS